MDGGYRIDVPADVPLPSLRGVAISPTTGAIGVIAYMKHILLSTNGGDRATAYTMSNKLIPLREGYLVTWIDSQRRNHWALVDLDNDRLVGSGLLGGPCVDNHCGAALVRVGEHVHAVTGGHHSPFQHYRMHSSQPGRWQHVARINVKGTYPSLAGDSQGGIHLAYRSPGDRWSLNYSRFQNGQWTESRALFAADKPGYIYWTNGLSTGPDDSLHLVFGNTRTRDDGALLYGASHVVSNNGGQTWRDDNDRVLPLPSPVFAVPLMIDADNPERAQSVSDQRGHEQPGPRNLNYHQMILSNPVVDPNGTVHVVLHNGLTGTADLMSRSTMGHWTAEPLAAAATSGIPNGRVHVQSSLTFLPDGRLRAAMMIEQTEECVWGAPGTSIVLVETTGGGAPEGSVRVTPTDPGCAHWLPAQPHCAGTFPERMPPLLYTRGVNAGGFGNNKNAVETDVLLCRT